MTLARLLIVALLFCSLPALPAFTQELQTGKLPAAGSPYPRDMIPPIANFMNAMKQPSAPMEDRSQSVFGIRLRFQESHSC